MGFRAAPVPVALIGVALFLSRSTLAQSASDRETARSLMQEGDQKKAARDFRGALARYQAADSLVHVTTTGLEVARVQVELGLLVEAREKLVEVARIPPKPGDPPVISEARAAALVLGDSLDSRIPGLRVSLRGASDPGKVTVEIDHVPIPPAALIAYRKLDPGPHVVEAHSGPISRKETLELREGENKEVELDLASEPTTSPSGAKVPPEAQAGSPSRSPYKALMYTGFGVVAAGVAVGTVTGILAFSRASAAKSIPPSQGGCVDDLCGPATDSDINASRAFGAVSTVSFIVAGVGCALGATSFFLAKSHGPSDGGVGASARVTPWLAPGLGGLSGSFE
jgi:hypothetical protein